MTEMTDEQAVKVVTEIAKDDNSSNGYAVPEETKALTRDDILRLGQSPSRFVRVEVPEWGGHVFVKEMTGKERDQYEISQVEGKGSNQRVNLINARAKLVAFTTFDSNHKRMFTEMDVKALGNLSSRALTRIYKIATDLSGLSEEDMEELTASLGEGRSASSGLNSR